MISIANRFAGSRYAPGGACGVMVLTILFSVFVLFYGTDFTDSFYHINKLSGNILETPMVFLSSWVGLVWQRLLGDQLLSFRVLNLLCYLTCLLAVGSYLIKEYPASQIVLYLSLSLFLFSCLSYNIFSYDGVANVCTVVLVVLALHYLRCGNMIDVALAGGMSAVLVCVRFPSVTAVPAILGLFGLFSWFTLSDKRCLPGKMLVIAALYGGTFILIFLALTSFFYGTPLLYLSAVRKGLAVSQGGSHGLHSLAVASVLDGITCFQYVCVLYAMQYFIPRLKLKRGYGVVLQGCVLLAYLFLAVRIGSPYSKTFCLFLTTCVYWLIASTVLADRDRQASLMCVSVGVMTLIPALGSNTGLLKTVNLILPLLPIICLVGVLNDVRERDGFRVVLACVLLFALVNKSQSFYEDAPGLFTRNACITTKKMKHIRTTQARKDFMDLVMRDIEQARKTSTPVLLFGTRSYVFYYLTGLKPLYTQSFGMDGNDSRQVDLVRRQVDACTPIVFIMDRYPDAPRKDDERVPTAVDVMLKEQRYTVRHERDYRVWTPPRRERETIKVDRPENG